MKFEGNNIWGKSVLSRLFTYNFPLYENSNHPQKSQGVHFVPPAPNQSVNFDTKTALHFGGLFLRLCPKTVYS